MSAQPQKIIPLSRGNKRGLDGRRVRPFDGGLVQSPGQPEEQVTRYHVGTKRREDREAFWRAVEMYEKETGNPLVLKNDKESIANIRVNMQVRDGFIILSCIAEAAFITLDRGWRLE